MATEIPTSDLDAWVEQLGQCKYLAEEQLKLLCERVRRENGRCRHALVIWPIFLVKMPLWMILSLDMECLDGVERGESPGRGRGGRDLREGGPWERLEEEGEQAKTGEEITNIDVSVFCDDW